MTVLTRYCTRFQVGPGREQRERVEVRKWKWKLAPRFVLRDCWKLELNWSPGQDASCDEASAGWVHDHSK